MEISIACSLEMVFDDNGIAMYNVQCVVPVCANVDVDVELYIFAIHFGRIWI